MIAEAVRVLKRGGVIAYPTETTYGLGCDPRNAKAIARIYRMKGREKKKPFLLVASSEMQVRKVARLEGATRALANRYWPGPLTLVLPRVNGKGKIAIRVSSSPYVQSLCRAFGYPIVSTSANRSGEPECRSGRAVRRVFAAQKEKPDGILDTGALPRRKPSTIARVHSDGSVKILRQGAVRL